ncbi:malate synthase G [Corynebacterium guangdongense]|uniref:Malate synthase G n=1 Tax=Corynebacterium guangdongense TaxID=1783348 RepID=A0ABU1ZUV1_9CORY|nr:malate synthase G [Corynebacterium guangdongense]MDR7328645.1 malate synthase [Corynebacterium guangdongense]WJZ17222.1 Malate synthase G [Corynebacterium guangdongense]
MTASTTTYVNVAGLDVADSLHAYATDVLCPRAGVDPEHLWQGLADIVAEFTPRNRALLARRDELQSQLDDYHRTHPGQPDPAELEQFLRSIGYLVERPADEPIRTANVDEEIGRIAGPQLVVPVLNSRYALNAANARWGSLYDALYGSDVISDAHGGEVGRGYNPVRGGRVIAWARTLLDEIAPLSQGSHADVTEYVITGGGLSAIVNGSMITLANPERYRGYQGDRANPSALLLRNNDLHAIIDIDRTGPIGKDDAAGVNDVRLESATSTIIDFEDSVAAVDATDKTLGYANWHGLCTGELTAEMSKGGTTFTRRLNEDLEFTGADGSPIRLHGRSLLLCRNVGHLMTNPAIMVDGEEIYEGLMDAVFTTLAALPSLEADNPLRNSRTGSIYIVKPKQHGPEEVAFTNDLFAAVEDLLGLERFTLKVGVMDEERRTSVNLDACIMAVADRLAFINTGFLDRTGDEIHSSMEAGPMERKAAMQTAAWKQAYEDNNVDAGIAHALPGRAQIGKGMWAMTDLMRGMVDTKIGQLREGANTAWVPSPTAATLHATHYHLVDVASVQDELRSRGRRERFHDLLTVPVRQDDYTAEDKREEMDNNCQSILGYVVRWIEQGVGCSRVPDIHDTQLMEDRATLRISSQILANWIRHNVVTAEEVVDSLERMAVLVDQQNADDPNYLPMAADFDNSIGFQAAKDLILQGTTQPSGYTEPILHARRREFKARHGLA